MAECDRLYHNNQDGVVLELCTFNRGSLKVKILKGVYLSLCFFLAFLIFSSRCFLKDKLESRIRPKCFCSFTVPLKVRCGCPGLTFLQENNTSVACLEGSGLNSIFH